MKVRVLDELPPQYQGTWYYKRRGQIIEVTPHQHSQTTTEAYWESVELGGHIIPESYFTIVVEQPSDLKDNINPSHYKSTKGFECIDVIEEVTKDLSGLEAVCTANAIKYLYRWKKKNGIEDCRKSLWYIQKLITHLENEGK